MSAYEELMKKKKERQQQILAERMKKYDEIHGVRVGDWIETPNGRMTRATYDWGEEIQDGGGEYGQFYLGDGYISYSGGLDPGVRKDELVNTGKVKNGKVWFFKDDIWTAGNGIEFIVPFRVFKLVNDDEHTKIGESLSSS